MTSDWTAERLQKLSSGYWESLALHAGVALDLFTVLGEERMSARQIAGATGCTERGISLLLDAFSAMGLLAGEKGTYSNTGFSAAFLSKASPQYMGHLVSHHANILPSWAGLAETIRTGKPLRARSGDRESEHKMEAYILGMLASASRTAPVAAEKVDLSGKRHLLDLGGGAGAYSIHFCLRNEDLRATVFDLPSTRKYTEMTVGRHGMSERISFEGGDFLRDPLGEGYDAAWLSHILHGVGPDQCRKVIGKAVDALGEEGVIFIHEFLLDDDAAGPLFPALFSLTMLVETGEGRAYPERQLRKMLADAGVGKVRRLALGPMARSAVLAGEEGTARA